MGISGAPLRQGLSDILERKSIDDLIPLVRTLAPGTPLADSTLRIVLDRFLNRQEFDDTVSLEYENYIFSQTALPASIFHKIISRDDCAIDDVGCRAFNEKIASFESNSFFAILRILADLNVKKIHRAPLIVTTVRNEGAWLLEWIAFYRAIGIDKFIIYSNDNTDGSDSLLEILCDSGIIDWEPTVTVHGLAPQKRAFAHALWKKKSVIEHSWVMFIDPDEFLDFDPSFSSLPLDLERFSEVDCVAVNWLWMSSENLIHWEDGLVSERFRFGRVHPMKKCIFRPELASSISQIHFPTMIPGAIYADVDGRQIEDVRSDRIYNTSRKVNFRHYFAKSFSEFLLKRLRGKASATDISDLRPLDAFKWVLGTNFEHVGDLRQSAKLGEHLSFLRSIPGVSEAEKNVIENVRSKISETYGSRTDIEEFFKSNLS